VFFDSTIQTLEMTRDPNRGSVRGADDVKIQSADGYTVSVDVTVKYRIREGMAHKLYQDTGSREKYKVIVRNEAEKACLALFGQMKTEDFYNPEVRRARQSEVKSKLSTSLDDNYVEIVDVLMRDVVFDPEYENRIQRRKLADQEVELNKSMAKAEEMRGKTQIIEAETRRILDVIEQERKSKLVTMEAQMKAEKAKISAAAKKYATQKKADADLAKAEMEARGALEVKKAEAEGEKLRNRAMMGVGGSTIVALEAARNLNLTEVTISTVDTDILDINQMATKLGVP
jgi:regulator of protease activity HflC (stomatin/prohibitin superfamily)